MHANAGIDRERRHRKSICVDGTRDQDHGRIRRGQRGRRRIEPVLLNGSVSCKDGPAFRCWNSWNRRAVGRHGRWRRRGCARARSRGQANLPCHGCGGSPGDVGQKLQRAIQQNRRRVRSHVDAYRSRIPAATRGPGRQDTTAATLHDLICFPPAMPVPSPIPPRQLWLAVSLPCLAHRLIRMSGSLRSAGKTAVRASPAESSAKTGFEAKKF